MTICYGSSIRDDGVRLLANSKKKNNEKWFAQMFALYAYRIAHCTDYVRQSFESWYLLCHGIQNIVLLGIHCVCVYNVFIYCTAHFHPYRFLCCYVLVYDFIVQATLEMVVSRAYHSWVIHIRRWFYGAQTFSFFCVFSILFRSHSISIHDNQLFDHLCMANSMQSNHIAYGNIILNR